MGTVVHLTDQSIQLSANNWNSASTVVQQGSSNWYSASGAAVTTSQNYTHTNFLPLSGGTITGSLSVNNNISVTGTTTASAINLQTVSLSSVIITGETKTSTTSVTATDVYVKVIVNNETKYLRLFDVI